MSNQNLESNERDLYAAYKQEIAQTLQLQVALRNLQRECTGLRHTLYIKNMELASADDSLQGMENFCQEVQARASTVEAEKAELVVENDELKARVEELTKLLLALQNQ